MGELIGIATTDKDGLISKSNNSRILQTLLSENKIKMFKLYTLKSQWIPITFRLIVYNTAGQLMISCEIIASLTSTGLTVSISNKTGNTGEFLKFYKNDNSIYIKCLSGDFRINVYNVETKIENTSESLSGLTEIPV